MVPRVNEVIERSYVVNHSEWCTEIW